MATFAHPSASLTLFRCFLWAKNDKPKRGAGLVSGWMGLHTRAKLHLGPEAILTGVAACT